MSATPAQALSARISELLANDVHAQVVELILRTKHDSPLLIAGSIIGMVWTSSGVVGVLLQLTPIATGYYLRYVAGNTPELFLMLSGVLVTCYLGALGLLWGAGVTVRIQLGHPLGPAHRPRDV